jgi:hypothetical protein
MVAIVPGGQMGSVAADNQLKAEAVVDANRNLHVPDGYRTTYQFFGTWAVSAFAFWRRAEAMAATGTLPRIWRRIRKGQRWIFANGNLHRSHLLPESMPNLDDPDGPRRGHLRRDIATDLLQYLRGHRIRIAIAL